MSGKRSNVWACVIYPDSMPENYLNIIQNWHIACLISPIHDSDLNGDGTEKKQHIHIMLYFGSGANKSIDQVKEFTDQLNGTIPIIVNNRNAMARYFIHKDNPEKHQYDINDLICISGYDLGNAFDSYTNDNLLFQKLEEIIYENKIYNFYVLVGFLRKNNFIEELNFLRRHTMYIKCVLDGRYHLVCNSVEKRKA